MYPVQRSNSRCPAWLRRTGWLVFSLWCVAVALYLGGWWLMKGAHERAQRILQSGPRAPSAMGKNHDEVRSALDAPPGTNILQGTPAAEVPLLAPILAGDRQAIGDMDQQLDELRSMLSRATQSRSEGKISFRLLLAELGVSVPEEMTEAEAAVDFLTRVDKFAKLVAKWKLALEKFPWDFSASPPLVVSDIVMPAARNIQGTLHGYLGLLAEARWRTGDSAGAWADWQLMRLNSQKLGPPTSHSSSLAWLRLQGELIQTLHAGFSLGSLTDAQIGSLPHMLSEHDALAAMRRGLEGEKSHLDQLFSRAQENREHLAPVAFPQFFPALGRISAALTTDQQLADNHAVLTQSVDYALDRFPAEAKMYVPPRPGETDAAASARHSTSWFDAFYFSYADPTGWNAYANAPAQVIETQSAVDQARLAAALELIRRQNGQYPDSLAAVSPQFPNGLPKDLATGGPYNYKLLPTGGYQLWGTGIDQVDDGGALKKDVVWVQDPPPAH